MSNLTEVESKAHLPHWNAERQREERPCFVGGMYITARQLLGSRAQNHLWDWFAGSEHYFTHSARTAIHRALQLMNLRDGDEILVPAYHCGSEVDVLLSTGANVRLFRVSSAGDIDAEDLKQRITTRTKAVYVIHYFGFPQPMGAIGELCRNRRLYLIEDCALSLLTEVDGHRIGSCGDLAIYNFPKTLAVPDGGALVINNPALARQGWRRYGPRISSSLRNLIPLLKQSTLHGLPGRWAKRLCAALRPIPERQSSENLNPPEIPSSYYFSQAMSDRNLSGLSAWLMARMDLAEVRARRRLNYSLLLKRILPLPGQEPLFKGLAAGVCPLYLPIVTGNARELAQKLRACSIPAIAWWSGYHRAFSRCEGFEEARFLKDHVVALPIHHQLNEGAIDFIAAQVATLLSTE